MKVEFTVHGVRKGHVSVDATIGGNKQRALVDGIEVELTADDGSSFTLRRHGQDAAEAEKLFQPASKVVATFEGY